MPKTLSMINSFAAHFLAPLLRRHNGVGLRSVAVGSRQSNYSSPERFGCRGRPRSCNLNLDLITDTDCRALETRLPVPGRFAKLGITLNADEVESAIGCHQVSPPRSSRRTWIGGCLRRGRMELFRGSLAEDRLPEQRIESAADYVSL